MSTFLRLTTTETKLFLREPIVVFFTIAFTPILFAIIGFIPAMREPNPDLGGTKLITLYLPIMIVMSIALFALSGLCQLFASYREKGILRRLRTTPVKPLTMITAQLTMALVLSLLTVLALQIIALVALDIPAPANPAAYLFSYLLVALAMFAIALLIAALAPTGKSANAIGTLAFFPLLFFAGLWLPRAEMTPTLRTISDLTPLGAGVQALQDATTGTWPQPVHLAAMLGWTIVAGGLAARFFRWE